MIDKSLLEEIKEYCKINNIDNIKKEINKILKIGFNIIKYGNTPFSSIGNVSWPIVTYQDDKISHTENDTQERNVEKVQVKQSTPQSSMEEKIKITEIKKPKSKIRIIKND